MTEYSDVEFPVGSIVRAYLAGKISLSTAVDDIRQLRASQEAALGVTLPEPPLLSHYDVAALRAALPAEDVEKLIQLSNAMHERGVRRPN